jgi:hypothetical protein
MPEDLQVAGKTVAQADLSFLKAGIAQRLRLERFEDALVESLQIACPKADGESRREPCLMAASDDRSQAERRYPPARHH